MRDSERASVKSANRLPNAEPARSNERLEDMGYSEFFNTVDVQLGGFVVERHECVTLVSGQLARDPDRRLLGHALGVHELDEGRARELPVGVKDRDVEIFVEGDPALLPLADHIFVA